MKKKLLSLILLEKLFLGILTGLRLSDVMRLFLLVFLCFEHCFTDEPKVRVPLKVNKNVFMK